MGINAFNSTAHGDKAYGMAREKDYKQDGQARLGLDSASTANTVNKRLPKEETV